MRTQLVTIINSGTQPLSIRGLLGGRGGQPGGARLVTHPLDGTGAALRAPYVVGHPTDRGPVATTLLPCGIYNQIAPAGTRAVLVRLKPSDRG